LITYLASQPGGENAKQMTSV